MSIGSLSSDVFERRTSTGSEVFSLLTCLDDIKFVFLSFFTVIEAIWLKICAKPPSKNENRPLPVDVFRSKTLLLKLPNISPRPQSWRAQSVANCGPAYDCKWRTGFLTRLFTHEKVTILLYFVSCRRIPDETMKARQIACVFFLNSDYVRGTQRQFSEKYLFGRRFEHLKKGKNAHFQRIFTLKRSPRIFGRLFSGWNFRTGKFWSL